MDAAIPVVEVANNADSLGVRRPHRKIDASLAINCPEMSAELIVNSPVLTFPKKVEVGLAHDGPVPVRIAGRPLVTGMGGKLQAIIQIPSRIGYSRAEKSVPMNLFRLDVSIGIA